MDVASDLSYAYLCANDHVVFSRPWLDGLTAIAAVLPRAGSMKLATTVALPVVRGPAAVAKELGAIGILSDGKLVVGVGPGSSGRDYERAGLDFAERWQRMDEAIRVLRAYWSGDQSFQGRFYSSVGFDLAPHPVQRPGPPIWVGSWGSIAGLRWTARLGDRWLASGYNTTPEVYAGPWRDLREALTAEGRDAGTFPNAIATMWTFVTEDTSKAEAGLEKILQPMLNRPVGELREKLPVGRAEVCVEKLTAYANAGAQHVFIWPVPDERRQLQVFMRDVAPLVARNAPAP